MSGLFKSALPEDVRVKAVIKMLGCHEVEFESEVMRHLASELLSKAERQAEDWLRNEISEVARGAADARIMRKY